MSERWIRSLVRLPVFAYLLGHGCLLVQTTLRRTSEHGPIATTREDLLRTVHIAMKEAAIGEVLPRTYLPVYVRTLSSEVDTPDHIRRV
jgi:hypothetical protein